MRLGKYWIAAATIALFTSIAVGEVSWQDFVSWATAKWSTPYLVMALTVGIAHESLTVRNVWEACYAHSTGAHIRDRFCHEQVVTAITRWAFELAGLGRIAGWWKRDGSGESLVTIGGLTGVKIDVFDTTADLVRRDTDTLNIHYNSTSIQYQPMMNQDLWDGNVDLVLFGFHSNDTMPVILLEANANGTWALNLMELDEITKRDGLDYENYIKGAGGMIFECQYGAGEKTDFMDAFHWYDSLVDIISVDDFMSAEYSVFHGYIGSNSRLKCAAKIYENDERAGAWRDWGDVWRSF